MDSVDSVATSLTVGMIEIGMALSMLFTGIAVLQLWNYFRNFKEDNWRMKLLICAVFCADAFHSGLLLHSSYTYTLLAFDGSPEALQLLTWSIQLSVLLTGIIAFVVQAYYCTRVYHLTSSTFVTALCIVLSVLRLAFNIATSTTIMRTGRWAVDKLTVYRWELSTLLVVGTAADVAIATAICAALIRLRTGFTLSDRLVDGLVALTIGSGLSTSIVSVTECIIYLGFHNYAFLVPFTITSKLYTNSLLASINEREHTRRAVTAVAFRLGGCQCRTGSAIIVSQPQSVELNVPIV